VKCFRFPSILILCLLWSRSGISQYILNGSAKQDNCNCYTLTTENNFQSGSVWNSNKISLNNAFDFWFNVYLGCNDSPGADGIVFILQPLSTSIGTAGEGMGFSGVSPSIGIALDTYPNPAQNDPAYDHISIQTNGNVSHNNDLAGPVAISSTSGNVEDCQWHKLRITWDPSTKWLRAYFDGVLRVEKQVDLIATIFGNDPNVYWGFTGATGGENNLQKFCTALNPIIATDLSIDTTCVGALVQFTSRSESFAPIAGYNWSFGDGSQSTSIDPSHSWPVQGTYPVHLKIRGMDGCENDTVKNIVVASSAFADVKVFDTCSSSSPRIEFHTNSFGVNKQWVVDDDFPGSQQQPFLNTLPAGNHNLKLIVSSRYGCGTPAMASSDFLIKPVPEIQLEATDGCINAAISFKGQQLDNKTSIDQWNWDFGDRSFSKTQNPRHSYTGASQYLIRLWADASNGCWSDTLKKTITINDAYAFAGNDTVVVRNLPFQLSGKSNGDRFQWFPSFGLNDPNIADPVATLTDRQDYILSITTPEGCQASDTIHIKAIEGPTIYVASAFTPNGDGLNDILHPVYVGITRLEKFAVYNRWGKLVFATSDMEKGWDGRVNGKLSETATYVWAAQAENYLHQRVILKGTITVIR